MENRLWKWLYSRIWNIVYVTVQPSASCYGIKPCKILGRTITELLPKIFSEKENLSSDRAVAIINIAELVFGNKRGI